MREQLIRYVDLLFAGAPNAQDVKQEILQNTLDRYDDLLQQGKSPEAAYSLAISGIGDVNDATISYMTKMYEDAGFTDVTITKSTATVAGEEIDALVTEMTVQGTSMVEKQVFFVSHDYLGTFTTSGISEKECDELLSWLSK